ncbi:hypothetical protein LTS10_005845 [Elasticomyces elasticus]|nr:hypothetical protein LTS10_005845 [Elasticomyces elasticus]
MTDTTAAGKRHHGEIDRPHPVTSGPPNRLKTQRVQPGLNHEKQKSKTLSIFDLPAELRNAIYECFFDDLVATPKVPFAQLPGNARFGQYTSLLRTNRQMCKEARSLFMQDYADKVTYYFTTGLDLVNFVSKTQNFEHGILRNASFLLCQQNDINRETYDFIVENSTESSIRIQPGFTMLWNALPVETFDLPKMTLLQGGHTTANGFVYSTDHTSCADSGRNTPERSLELPTLAAGCRLMYHSWYAVPKHPSTYQVRGQSAELSCVTLKGRLARLSIKKFELDEANQAAAHAAGETCDVEPCHECHCHYECLEESEIESEVEEPAEEPEEELVGGEDDDYGSDSEHWYDEI